jgi:hypothetical protein
MIPYNRIFPKVYEKPRFLLAAKVFAPNAFQPFQPRFQCCILGLECGQWPPVRCISLSIGGISSRYWTGVFTAPGWVRPARHAAKKRWCPGMCEKKGPKGRVSLYLFPFGASALEQSIAPFACRTWQGVTFS